MNEISTHVNLHHGSFTYLHSLTRSPHDDQHSTYMQNAYEIYYLISGNVVYQVEDQSYPLNPGDLLIINNMEMHRPYFTSDSSYERIIIFFKPDFCSHYIQEGYSLLQYFDRKRPGSFNRLPGPLVEQAQLAAHFMEIEELHHGQLPESCLLIELSFIRLLVKINQMIASHIDSFELEGNVNAKIEQIIAYIHDNLYGSLTLQHIEHTFFVNRYYFSHQFKKITGCSFKQYIIQKRITKAIELLKLSVPPTEVCSMTGFQDYSNFYRTFKRITGVSPAKYGQ
ncbi:AraC-like DNA-binding protein [Paenibacillus endophyticus]|uniref:AraC-like DNA-binding protein n=1 Tax=Paenibacillus endophyticus TaxID=1294268 RepID=A0A7W5CDF1_9BACL|nr:AraC family transcriptional regulator [Paenibacillus endophyticus]MBB3154789.1 AraC-like DNA-binding protein [Paenibacillus endophyticus]